MRQTQSTVHLAIRYLDIILCTENAISQVLPYQNFKAVATVCLNIASKFDALNLGNPLISELQRATGCYIPYETLINYEGECWKILNWDLKLVTLFHVLEAVGQQGIIFSDDTRNGGKSIEMDLDVTTYKAKSLLDYFTDFMTKEESCVIYKPTQQAIAWIVAVRKLLGIDNPFSSTLSEMLLCTKNEIPSGLYEATDKLLSLLELEFTEEKQEILEIDELLKVKLKNRIKKLAEIHDYTGRIFTQKRQWTSVYSSSENSSKKSNPEVTLSSDEAEENGGYFYYEDSGIPIPYNLDEADLDYIEEQLQRQMMYAQMPLAPIRSASVGSEGKGDYKHRISSLFGENTKGSTSGKENYEDLNNEESPLFLEEFYHLNKKHMLLKNSQDIKFEDGNYIKSKNLEGGNEDDNERNSCEEDIQPEIVIV